MLTTCESLRQSLEQQLALTWARKPGTVANFVAASSSLHKFSFLKPGFSFLYDNLASFLSTHPCWVLLVSIPCPWGVGLADILSIS